MWPEVEWGFGQKVRVPQKLTSDLKYGKQQNIHKLIVRLRLYDQSQHISHQLLKRTENFWFLQIYNENMTKAVNQPPSTSSNLFRRRLFKHSDHRWRESLRTHLVSEEVFLVSNDNRFQSERTQPIDVDTRHNQTETCAIGEIFQTQSIGLSIEHSVFLLFSAITSSAFRFSKRIWIIFRIEEGSILVSVERLSQSVVHFVC